MASAKAGSKGVMRIPGLLQLGCRSAQAEIRRRIGREGEWTPPPQEGRWEVQRLFIGQENQNATLEMRDTKGRSRIRMIVDSLDVPLLEFLDLDGTVVYRFPPG
jgi:hypothetical protein